MKLGAYEIGVARQQYSVTDKIKSYKTEM